MSTYTVMHTASGETAEVDTNEEIVSPPIFDLLTAHTEGGEAYWSDVSFIEGASEALARGDIADAERCLNQIDMTLKGKRPEPSLTPYDTGERATPIPWVSGSSDFTAMPDGRDPDDFGRVDFEDDESSTVATIHLSRRDDGGYTAHIIPARDGVQIEWHGEGSARLIEEN